MSATSISRVAVACATLAALATVGGKAIAQVTLNSISVDVALQGDGSAHITEVWDVDVAKTRHNELYQTRYAYSAGLIQNFTVTEHGSPLQQVTPWDLDARDKQGRCGIYQDSDTYQLCWGLGAPGRHRYTLEYTATRVVRPYGVGEAAMRLTLYGSSSLPPKAATAHVWRADSALTDDDVVDWEYNDKNVEGSFDDGRFTLTATSPMTEDDHLTLYAVFDAEAFGGLDLTGMSTDISADELASPMMSERKQGKYENSWLDKFWDFYEDWPLLTLFSILAAIVALFYVVKKIAIALA